MIVRFVYTDNDHASVGVGECNDLLSEVVARYPAYSRLIASIGQADRQMWKTPLQLKPNSFFRVSRNESGKIRVLNFLNRREKLRPRGIG